MKYIVQATAVWDFIYLPGSNSPIQAPGGAGFYAMCGMKVWEDAIEIVTGTGSDYLPNIKEWYDNNHLSIDGFLFKEKETPRTIVRYSSEDSREETSELGAQHYGHIEASPQEVAPFLQDAAGIYIFKNENPTYWSEMLSLLQNREIPAMWEIASDAAKYEKIEAVRRIAESIDVFSINRTEAMSLFHANDMAEVMHHFQSWEVPLIYLRMGSEGVCLMQAGRQVFVPSVQGLNVVDTTGGGNASSGGALIGYCRGCSLEEIGAMGNVSASFIIEQWGVPKLFDETLHKEAEMRKKALLEMCAGEKV